MKKYLYSLILFMCILTGPVIAKEYTVKTDLKANVWNEFLDNLISQDMHLNYDTKSRSLLWYVNYTMFNVVISLNEPVRRTLIKYIQKYKEWNRKASKKGVKIDKEIGEVPLTAVWFKYGDDWHKDNSVTIRVKFLSLSAQRHLLTVCFDKLESIYNEYITYKPDTLYFWWNEVVSFEKAISDKAIEKYINEVNKKESIEKDFR